MRLQDLDPSIRPDEIGTPWAIDGRGYFTDAGHQDVLHIGFDEHPSMQLMAVADAHKAAPPVPVDAIDYPGDDASREQIAAWMAAAAEKRGLPGQLPVMASLVESGMHNLNCGDARLGRVLPDARRDLEPGPYAGYPDDPSSRSSGSSTRPRRSRSSASPAASRSTTRTSSASGSPTSSARPSSTAAATSCGSTRPRRCSRSTRPRLSRTRPHRRRRQARSTRPSSAPRAPAARRARRRRRCSRTRTSSSTRPASAISRPGGSTRASSRCSPSSAVATS